MVRNLKCLSIAACVVCVVGILPAIRGRDTLDTAQAQPKSVEPEDRQTQAATILLEAFVVEVNLPALAELGVSPIGRSPHNVSVENILACLESRQARVLVGAKEAVQNERDGKIRATHATYVRRDGSQGRGQVSYAPYEDGAALSVRALILSARFVEIDYSLSCSVFAPRSEAEDVPPDTESWEWQGNVVLRPGEPMIAAAAQDWQRVVFLMLTAHVHDR